MDLLLPGSLEHGGGNKYKVRFLAQGTAGTHPHPLGMCLPLWALLVRGLYTVMFGVGLSEWLSPTASRWAMCWLYQGQGAVSAAVHAMVFICE